MVFAISSWANNKDREATRPEDTERLAQKITQPVEKKEWADGPLGRGISARSTAACPPVAGEKTQECRKQLGASKRSVRCARQEQWAEGGKRTTCGMYDERTDEGKKVYSHRGSNPGPRLYQSRALPTELWELYGNWVGFYLYNCVSVECTCCSPSLLAPGSPPFEVAALNV